MRSAALAVFPENLIMLDSITGRGGDAHSARRGFPHQVQASLCADLPRRPARRAARGLPSKSDSDRARSCRRRWSRSRRTADGVIARTESRRELRGARADRRGRACGRRSGRSWSATASRWSPATSPTAPCCRPSEMPERLALVVDGAVGRREGASRALSDARRRAVQPRRGVPFEPLRGGLGQLWRSGRAARAFRQDLRAGAHAARQDRKLAHVGAVRPAADQGLEPRPHDAARRRRPSDAAIPGAGRLHGDRGRGVPRQQGRGA